jgi:hypothetical protein
VEAAAPAFATRVLYRVVDCGEVVGTRDWGFPRWGKKLKYLRDFFSVWNTVERNLQSGRAAECTRLILTKNGFGGDLGALDRCVDECRKDARI